MFSGIIKNISKIEFNQNKKLGIRLSRSSDKKGDSLAINGVCLTLVNKTKKKGGQVLFFDLSDETLEKSTLNRLKPGQPVNLERALKVSDVLGGHIVQGHVDGVGTIRKIVKKRSGWDVWIEAPKTVTRTLVQKGSVAVDGISLTVVKVKGNQFSVALIPFTVNHTNLKKLQLGQKVNLETDVIDKYVSKYLKIK